jgi:hypothetical protein
MLTEFVSIHRQSNVYKEGKRIFKFFTRSLQLSVNSSVIFECFLESCLLRTVNHVLIEMTNTGGSKCVSLLNYTK